MDEPNEMKAFQGESVFYIAYFNPLQEMRHKYELISFYLKNLNEKTRLLLVL